MKRHEVQQRNETARQHVLASLSHTTPKGSSEISWPQDLPTNCRPQILRQLREAGKISMSGTRRGAKYLLLDAEGQVRPTKRPERPPVHKAVDFLDYMARLPDGLQGQRQAPLLADVVDQWSRESGRSHNDALADVRKAIQDGFLRCERRFFWPETGVGQQRGSLAGHRMVLWVD